MATRTRTYNSSRIQSEKLLTSKYMLSASQLELLVDLRIHVILTTPTRVQNLDAFFIPAVVDSQTFENLIGRFESVYALKRGVSLARLVLYYGDEIGAIKYEEYKRKQADTNTFEYKRKKYNWSEFEFKEYNASRQITLENCITRYGDELGTKQYYEYVAKQSYSKTLEYNIEKYGLKEGTVRYKSACSKKGATIENYTRLYGPVDAENKLIDFFSKTASSQFYSQASQVMCWHLDNMFPDLAKSSMFQEKSNKEFASYQNEHSRCYKYDYVQIDDKIVIEYHGDHWHANPKLYQADQMLKIRKQLSQTRAADVWAADLQKRLHIESRGYRYFVVWEQDWVSDRDLEIERLKNAIAIRQ